MVRPMADNENERGVGQTDFGFHRVPESEKSTLVRAVFAGVAERYDLMNDLMSAGIHRLWKAVLIDALAPQPGMRLLDIAGGTGDIAFRVREKLMSRPPVGEPTEIMVCDINHEMIEVGLNRAIDRGILDGISWICADAEALPLPDMSVDACTVAFGLRNMTHLDQALAEARRVLRPGGRFLCLEFSHVSMPILEQLYDRYSFSVLPIIGRLVTGQEGAYRYLAESIRRFPRQQELARRMSAIGFDRVDFRNLSGGIAALHGAWRL
jgi:demethylmenaquinone methyltransferase/2-methoxy-6-polyprenyl-1,4-benzoquinol methylase